MGRLKKILERANEQVREKNIQSSIDLIVKEVFGLNNYSPFERVRIMNEVMEKFKSQMKNSQNSFYEKGREIKKAMESLKN